MHLLHTYVHLDKLQNAMIKIQIHLVYNKTPTQRNKFQLQINIKPFYLQYLLLAAKDNCYYFTVSIHKIAVSSTLFKYILVPFFLKINYG